MNSLKRFIRDNAVNSFEFPEEFKSDFSSFLLRNKLIGSVSETLMAYTEITLPNRYTRDGFDSETKTVVQALIQKVKQTTHDKDEVSVNSVFLQYSSLTIKEKTFYISSRTSPFIALAEWKKDYYGAPPTSLGSIELRHKLLRRPIKIRNFLKVTYSINSVASTMMLAFVSWMKPHQHRHYIGKPAELWKEWFEVFGIYSFIPLDTIICRCAHGTIHINSEKLRMVIPLL